jgi:SAM-dependent methyltransferase
MRTDPSPASAPAYDDAGLNLADPGDRRGLKTDYISRVQSLALERHVGRGSGLALDLGCGYGRMTRQIASMGYDVVGLDPSLRILRYARGHDAAQKFCAGRMPDLPFADGTFDTVFLLNVVRPLHLLGLVDVCSGAARMVAPGGRLVVLDNLRAGDARYVDASWFETFFERHGLRLVRRVAIRAARAPLIYLIRYGLVPRAWFDRLAARELARMEKKTGVPRWQYHNVIFVFERR